MLRTGQTILVILFLAVVAGCGKGPEDLPRVLVVVVEGADPEIVGPLIEAGKLPAFERLVREGTQGTLHSTIPPVTPPAWAAISTGKNPGRTGIYQWAVLIPGSYSGDPVAGVTMARERPVWDLVGEAGGQVIVVNVPFTFPPVKVNGILVCGLPADENGVFAYPSELAEQLRQKGYIPFFKSPQPVETYLSAIEERAAMIAKYMRRTEWNLCMVSFKNLDEICHIYIDDPEIIEAAYIQVDRALASLIETAGPETTVMVISDHGYGKYDRYFSINRWLLEEKYLYLRGWINDSLQVVPYGEEGPTDLGLGRYQIFWPRTRAFSIADCHSNFGHIQLNVRGREPVGTVELGSEHASLVQEIKRRLLDYRDPETGEHIVKHVFTREDLFTGDRLEDLPEIFFETVPGVLPLGVMLSGFFELSHVVGPVVPGRNHPYHGDHERGGFFAMLGPDVRAGVEMDTELLNIAPTILYLIGIPQPPDFDGSVIQGVFTEARLAQMPVQMGEKEARRDSDPEFIVSPRPPDGKEQDLLNALGYIR